ncbi:prolyl oligopeptidase family serine peptidase [Bradyrhizobium sp. RT5a]|uniref:prolyl oligopeptidase family serine peptidase n=1 Tax=unclassified Bradyrhizobium TaxID=2631580 RepID=UPI00339991AB
MTQAKRIAAESGSNGGILIINMLTRYPERFGTLFCTSPLIDMCRYSKRGGELARRIRRSRQR